MVTLGKNNKDIEIERRRSFGWAVFGKLAYILKNMKIPQYSGSRVYDQYMLPV